MLQTSVPCACEGGYIRRGFGGYQLQERGRPTPGCHIIHKAGEHEVVEERAVWGGGVGGGRGSSL